MPKYFSNLQFWCPDCTPWHKGIIILPGILHLCTFCAQEVSQNTPHWSQEAEGFIGKEKPASPSLTQWPGMWSSVSLHPDNGISSEQEDLPGNGQGTEVRPQPGLCVSPHHQEGTTGWAHKPLYSPPGWNCCSQASVTAAFSQLGVVPGCSCPPGRRNCSNVKI